MTKRIIIVLLAIVLLLAGCSSAPKAPAYDPAVAALLADFDPAAGREQPYGLPPSYAPDEVWEAAQRRIDDGTFDGIVYTELHDTGLTRTEAAERRAEMELAGGYQCWEFRAEQQIMDAGDDLWGAVSLKDEWCFLLFFQGTPLCFVRLIAFPGGYRIDYNASFLDQMSAALADLSVLYGTGEARSPVLCNKIGSEGPYSMGNTASLWIVAEEGGAAAWASSCGSTSGSDILHYAQKQIRWCRRYNSATYGYYSFPWKNYRPPETGKIDPSILVTLSLGFGVWFALLLAATIGIPALMRRRG